MVIPSRRAFLPSAARKVAGPVRCRDCAPSRDRTRSTLGGAVLSVARSARTSPRCVVGWPHRGSFLATHRVGFRLRGAGPGRARGRGRGTSGTIQPPACPSSSSTYANSRVPAAQRHPRPLRRSGSGGRSGLQTMALSGDPCVRRSYELPTTSVICRISSGTSSAAGSGSVSSKSKSNSRRTAAPAL